MDKIVWSIVFVVACCLLVRLVFMKTITWLETAAIIGLLSVIVCLGYVLTFWSATDDTLILNGQVIGKERNQVNCEHAYRCNCRQSCSDKTCSQVCNTCFEHRNDWDWDVQSTVGVFTINRIDKRGSQEPPRWTEVKLGEPAANTYSYTNYLKAAPNSLFNMKLAEQEAKK